MKTRHELAQIFCATCQARDIPIHALPFIAFASESFGNLNVVIAISLSLQWEVCKLCRHRGTRLADADPVSDTTNSADYMAPPKPLGSLKG